MTENLNSFIAMIKKECNRKHALGIFIICIAIVGIFNAFRFGGASLDYYFVRNIVSAWQSDQSVTTLKEYDQAEAAIQAANLLHHSNPLYIDLSGQISEWGAVSGFDQQDSLNRAKLKYLQATKVRPLWPVTWANLSMVKWRLQEFDAEMLYYLMRANELGKQTVEVHILFTRLGIALYQAKNPMYTQIKDIVHDRIRLGLRNQQAKIEILAYIDATQSSELICSWMQAHDPYTADKHLECS